MPGFEVWDIVRVPFPYADRPVFQRRPALVIGQQSEPGSPDLVWLLMITSASHRRRIGDVEIADLPGAGLPAPSMIRCAKIATVEADSIEPIGRLAGPHRSEVRTHIVRSLGAVLSFSD